MVELGVELHHLLPPYDVAIQVAHLPGQGIERAHGAPLLIVAGARRHRCPQTPGGRDFVPAPIAKLIQEQRDHPLRLARRLTQTTVQPPHFAAVVRVGAE